MATNDLKAKFEQDIKGATPKGTDTLRGNIRKRGSIPKIGKVSQHPSKLLGDPRAGVSLPYASSICKCTEEGQGPDGGTSGTPTRFPPGVCGWGWAGKAVAQHMAHPRQRPGHNRPGKTEEGQKWSVPVEGVAGLGVSRPALCAIACLFRAGPPKTRSPMDPPGKRHIAP